MTVVPPSAAAGSLELGSPLRCKGPDACIVQNYVDTVAGGEARDFACNGLTYDGHGGTDLRVVQPEDYREGVEVIAAADGVVRAVRDAMPDAAPGQAPTPNIDGREAGNAVVIRHGERWETQYSHLRRDSVRVRPGQHVERGTVLGTVGLSGRTEFPHLHFAVRREGTTLDPYTGMPEGSGCDARAASLWSEAARERLAYRPGGVLRAGFLDRGPRDDALRGFVEDRGAWSADARAMVFWVKVFGARAGDVLTLELRGPDGERMARRRHRFDRDKANYIMFIGRRRGDRPRWPAGTYVGVYSWQRGDEPAPYARGKRRLRMQRDASLFPGRDRLVGIAWSGSPGRDRLVGIAW